MDVSHSEEIPPPTQVIVLPASPPHDPPPPYPSRERRRGGRPGRRRRTLVDDADHLQLPSTGTESEFDFASPSTPSHFPTSLELDDTATETTPLLHSPRLPSGGISRRQRTLSVSSAAPSVAPSFAQTVLSAFDPERDCDLDPDEGFASNSDENDLLDSPTPRGHFADDQARLLVGDPESSTIGRRVHTWRGRWRRYFRPMTRRAYYSALFHLVVINFPYALLAWLYLFVFTLTGTTTLMALPLGALLCFLDLLGARTFARGELSLQTTFHGPLSFPLPSHLPPIFTRLQQPLASSDLESSYTSPTYPTYEHSFYKNAYGMFTDPTSYQALFYFLVIKPGITVFLSLLMILVVPIAFVLVLPAPAMLRLVRRLGVWQANVAVEGLCYVVR